MVVIDLHSLTNKSYPNHLLSFLLEFIILHISALILLDLPSIWHNC
jgi:hypothetical protein